MLTLIILSSLSPPAPTQILLSLMLRTSVRKNCRAERKCGHPIAAPLNTLLK